MPRGTYIRDALERLRQFEQGNTVQPGMFSTLDELIKDAPQDMTGDQWIAYLKPGRMLKRGDAQFPLKKEELEWAGEFGLSDVVGGDVKLTRDELRNIVRQNRQGFALTMNGEVTTAGGKVRLTDPTPLDWHTYDGLPDGVNVGEPRYGADYAGDTDSRLFHQSPSSTYEESVTHMPGLDERSHFDPDTLSWSRTSTHNVENPSYQPSSGQTKRHDKVRLVEEIQSDLQSSAAEPFLLEPRSGQYYRSVDEAANDLDGTIYEDELDNLQKIRRGHMDQDSMVKLEEAIERLDDIGVSMKGVSLINPDGTMNLKYVKLRDASDKLAHEVGFLRNKPQNAPYKNPRDYAGLELRKQLLNAAENGEDYLALVRGKDQVQRYSQGMDDRAVAGMEKMYDEVYPSELRKLANRYGAEIVDVEVPVTSGSDVRPPTMTELQMEHVDDLGALVSDSMGFSETTSEVLMDLESYVDDVNFVGAEMEWSGTASKKVEELKRRLEVISKRAEQTFRGALAEDQVALKEYQTDVVDEFKSVHEDFRALYEQYEQSLGGGGRSIVKDFPAIKLTPELREKIINLGVPQYAEGGAVRMQRGGGLSVFSSMFGRPDAQIGDEERDEVMSALSESDDERALQKKMGTGKYWADALKFAPAMFLARIKQINPETGEVRWVGRAKEPDIEMVNRGMMTMDEWREERDAAIRYNEENADFHSGFVDDVRSMAALPSMIGNVAGEYGVGPGSLSDPEKAFPYPEFAMEAAGRIGELERHEQEEFGLEDPTGLPQHLMGALGAMGAQVPVPGAPLRQALGRATGKIPKSLRLAASPVTKPLSAASEFINPFIEPKMSNYAMGTAFGGALGAGLEPSGEDIREIEDIARRQEEFDDMAERVEAMVDEGWGELSTDQRIEAMYSPFGEVVWERLNAEQRAEVMEELEARGAFEDAE